MAFLDFSKAFDTINHEMLLAKLKFFGLSDKSIAFFKSYLEDRSHCVILKEFESCAKSTFSPVKTGVPQGSILGPLLFSIYVADMHNVLTQSKILQYADDSQIYLSFSPNNFPAFQQTFTKEINMINKYAHDHNLKLNASKSSIILFGNNKNQVANFSNVINIQIQNAPLPVVTEAKNLGIVFDNNLLFEMHI